MNRGGYVTLEEFQTIGRGMIAEARVRFREQALAFCQTDMEREKVQRLESAIGEVSPEEAVYAFRLWLNESRSQSLPERSARQESETP
jgi:hypothetical protein